LETFFEFFFLGKPRKTGCLGVKKKPQQCDNDKGILIGAGPLPWLLADLGYTISGLALGVNGYLEFFNFFNFLANLFFSLLVVAVTAVNN